MNEDDRIKRMMVDFDISEEQARQILKIEPEFKSDVLDGVPVEDKPTIVDLLPDKFKLHKSLKSRHSYCAVQ